MMQRIKEWMCKRFGHKFNGIGIRIFRIELEAILYYHDAKSHLDPILTCLRCGERFGAVKEKIPELIDRLKEFEDLAELKELGDIRKK